MKRFGECGSTYIQKANVKGAGPAYRRYARVPERAKRRSRSQISDIQFPEDARNVEPEGVRGFQPRLRCIEANYGLGKTAGEHDPRKDQWRPRFRASIF